MDTTHWLWIATAVYGLHALEEMILNWRDWARAIVKVPVEWSHFYVVNFLVIVLGIVAVHLLPAAPWLALAFPALMIINAVFFHILPMLRTRGRYSPGVATACVLMLPVAYMCFRAEDARVALETSAIVGAFLVAALLMALPIVLLKIKDHPYFRQAEE